MKSWKRLNSPWICACPPCQALKQQLLSLQEEVRGKESRWASTQSRLRQQIDSLRQENSSLRGEVPTWPLTLSPHSHLFTLSGRACVVFLSIPSLLIQDSNDGKAPHQCLEEKPSQCREGQRTQRQSKNVWEQFVSCDQRSKIRCEHVKIFYLLYSPSLSHISQLYNNKNKYAQS